MLVQVKKTASGYFIERLAQDEHLPEGDFLAELQPLAQSELEIAAAETPAARLHAILAGDQPAAVDKENYLTYLEARYR